MILVGKCSEFGGKDDVGMANDDGLSFYEHAEADKYPDLFLPRGDFKWTWQRLRSDKFFIALNLPYGVDRKWVQRSKWKITNSSTDKSLIAKVVDRGPSAAHRVVDCSQGILDALGVKTDAILIVEEILE